MGPGGADLVGPARAARARARGDAGRPYRGAGQSPQRGADRMTRATAAPWPPLPYREWRPTKQTLHRYAQIVGKLRMSLVPFRNHWWHVTLYVSAHGLTTGPMPAGDREVEIELDFVDHRAARPHERRAGRAASRCATGSPCARLLPRPRSPRCATWASTPRSSRRPFDLGDSPAFPDDREHDSYDADAVERYWRVLRRTDAVLVRLRVAVQRQGQPDPRLLALLRPRPRALLRPPRAGHRGRRPRHGRGLLARGHRVRMVAGRRPHARRSRRSTPTPRPSRRAARAAAGSRPRRCGRTPGNGSLAVLPYDVVREPGDPAGTLLDFFESAYQAGARTAGWDAEAFDTGRAPRP